MSAPQSRVDVLGLAGATLQWLNEHAAEGIFTTDTELRVHSWNQWMHAATGISGPSAIGRPLFDVVPSLRERGLDRHYREALAGEISILSYALHRYIVPSGRPDVEQSPQTGRVAPLLQGGAVVGTITVIVDVAERVAAERELRSQIATAESARIRAEQASRVKDEFLATLSHEIRTPLNAVLGWTRILRSREADPAMITRAIEVIDRNASAQLTLITDMLDMARITAGKARMNVVDVDLAATILAAVDVVRPAADAKGIDISTQLPARLPSARGDADRLLQVFWNLLSNAVKFTGPGGRVVVSAAQEGHMLHVAVADSGEGIAADFLPQVFDRFKQADTSTSRRHGGLGLGLALVREIVHLHGGSIEVESRGLHQGTTFTVALPVPPAVDFVETRTVVSAPALNGIHVLVVEDDADAREIVATSLSGAGASVNAVATAADALSTLQDVREKRPDVVVADIGLPGQDGFGLLAEARRLPPEQGGTLPFIAVTAYATGADRGRALEAGFYAHVAKPFDPELLIETIWRAVDTTRV